MDLSFLPAVNAALNGLAGVLLVVGLILIKQGKRDAHKKVMLSAFGMSALFLVSYLTHYAWRAIEKGGVHTKFNGEAPWNYLYYLMLITHILLAMAVPVLAVWLIYLGWKGRDSLHKKVARWGWPIWMYVSVTGVLIYFALYHWNPAPSA